MDNLFNNKWFIRVISLVFAISLYVLVNIEGTTTQPDSRLPVGSDADRVQTLDDVPVNIRLDGDRYVVSGVPEYISVSLEGPNSILIPTIMQRNFDFYVDLRDLGEGTHTVDIEYTRVPEELKVYIEPKTISVTIEERVTVEFDVDVDFINIDQLPEGYEIGDLKVEPETVVITSSRSIYEQISMVKVFIDVGGLKESINKREVPVNVYDSQGNGLSVRIHPETVVVSVDIHNPSKVVPITIETENELPEYLTDITFTLSEKDIEIFATSDRLAEIESIATEKIDLSTIEESGTITVPLDVPEGVVVEEDVIEVTFEVEEERTLQDVPIQYENLEMGQQISFVKPDEPLMRITVVGKDKDVKELSADDFELSIDLEGLLNGEFQVPVLIKGPDSIQIELEYEEVTVRITES